MVASRLSASLKDKGWDSTVIAATASDLKSEPFRLPLHTASALIDNYVIKNPAWKSLISLERDRQSISLPSASRVDVLHLHWMNGMSDLNTLPLDASTRVVWTLHDMNPFTGVCHHSFSCTNFEKTCEDCPAVRIPFRGLVVRNLERKKDAVTHLPNLRVVAPSSWLAEHARRSAVLGDFPIEVIPNPIDPAFFASDRHDQRNGLSSELIAVLIAADLDDPIKDVNFAVASFSKARKERPNIALKLIGRGGHQFHGTPGVELLGSLEKKHLIIELDQSDVLVISSLAENSPSVAYEAASRGVTPWVRSNGGLPEMVQNINAGSVFSSTESLENLFLSATRASQSTRDRMRRKTQALCGPDAVAGAYIKVYEDRT